MDFIECWSKQETRNLVEQFAKKNRGGNPWKRAGVRNSTEESRNEEIKSGERELTLNEEKKIDSSRVQREAKKEELC